MGRPRQSTPEQEQMAIDLYQSGLSMEQVAEKVGWGGTWVRDVLVRHNIPRRAAKFVLRIAQEELGVMVAEWTRGDTILDIASRHHLSPTFVSRTLQEQGCETRGRRTAGKLATLIKGYSVRNDGYRLVVVPADSPFASMRRGGRNYVLEHRLVMAQHLGRPLRSVERVHHRNGDRADNRIENLELWEHPSQPSGQRAAEVKHCPTCTCN